MWLVQPEASGFLVGERALQRGAALGACPAWKAFKPPWAAWRWGGRVACTGSARNPSALLLPTPRPTSRLPGRPQLPLGPSQMVSYGWPSAPPTSLSSSAPPARRVSSLPPGPQDLEKAALFQVTAVRRAGEHSLERTPLPQWGKGPRRLFKEILTEIVKLRKERM